MKWLLDVSGSSSGGEGDSEGGSVEAAVNRWQGGYVGEKVVHHLWLSPCLPFPRRACWWGGDRGQIGSQKALSVEPHYLL